MPEEKVVFTASRLTRGNFWFPVRIEISQERVVLVKPRLVGANEESILPGTSVLSLVWFEVTTLLIPGHNDSDAEIAAECAWFAAALGPDVPLHFTAFHPDWKMLDVPHTPPGTLTRARRIALEHGLRFVYTGNVHDERGGSTWCPGCGAKVIGRDWYVLTTWRLDREGRCEKCGTPIPGHFEPLPGTWGARRQPVRLADFAA
jgi:pyruvate formate lyase activating enzyme